MKECSVFQKGMCLVCTGLEELDWCGAEQCSTYQKLKNISGLEICKNILEKKQMQLLNLK